MTTILCSSSGRQRVCLRTREDPTQAKSTSSSVERSICLLVTVSWPHGFVRALMRGIYSSTSSSFSAHIERMSIFLVSLGAMRRLYQNVKYCVIPLSCNTIVVLLRSMYDGSQRVAGP